MQFSSVNDASPAVAFPEALRRGLAPDGGLYMPDHIPEIPAGFWQRLRREPMTNAEIGKVLLRPWLGEFLSDSAFEALIDDALNFEAPLVDLNDELQTQVLELFHGPTLAFKDFAARTMGRLMAQLLREEGQQLHVLTATSGDTGAAVADGFFGVEGITVWVLYPSGKVSALQEKQFTTLGGNVRALEIDGTFDDCQRLVKQAFVDEKLRAKMRLTSANSINIGRLLPQMVYYVRALSQLFEGQPGAADPVFIVPSGNFGNLTAGLLAAETGMPAHHFVAATNRNRTFYDYIQSGTYRPRASARTISNAMDVGDPSNFTRMLALFGEQHGRIRERITPFWVDDETTTAAVQRVYDRTGYIMDPHTAVGYEAWQRYRSASSGDRPGILLATAHPAKFGDVMPEAIRKRITLPPALEKLHKREKKALHMPADYEAFKAELLKMSF
jgi:threonine synthase